VHAPPADAKQARIALDDADAVCGREWRTPFLEFWLHGLTACVGFGLTVLYCMIRVSLRYRMTTVAHDTARLMHRLVCPPLRLRVRVNGAERMQIGSPCIYVANHQSYLDYPVLARVLPLRTVIVGKSEMQRIPIVGWLFRRTGNWFIPRGDAMAAQVVLEQLAGEIRQGTSVWMFPEGTRRSTSEPMLRFRSGAFRLAAMAGVPVVPVVLSSVKPGVDIRARRLEPASLSISVLEPVYVRSGERGDVVEAMSCVRERMVECFVGTSQNPDHSSTVKR
jgi:1-acyl-sn-glycerol-3-phosphate acyltransferase